VSLVEEVTSSSRDSLDDRWHGTGGMGRGDGGDLQCQHCPSIFFRVVRSISMWNGLSLDAADVSVASSVGSASM
jgi:hypothetical protein